MEVKKFIVMLGLLFVSHSLPLPMSTAHAQQEVPAYAKWGQLAIKEVKSKYPTAQIVDYLHEGKEVHGLSTIEKFKLWLKQPDKEFGVHVKISYLTATQEVEKIEFQESSS
ncbi:DUF3889 domain-containing protein [Lysinibacillus irui]|uniref:DUF3889 domain-containing protein n=1 Tax=Lysinibacillus irui TaxID=2998077 RepID=A0AAJ5RL51_9BACI|nr:DUF3889 domain-containing protein [Lysinibacillus irui]MEA0552327.1 DUF3889 domain-containing protein [Lysinibacillus irui]MEA0563962.1 DUF3889 domain-containing protein [Lysinibacillus irui]MEA0977459.1 DUF3889 domain-containing protein [Lysinibacillus irui]MEA1043613.1 DUF3889 domain-containing protein [Lysinibacillus irui]WDV08357.1 DUF3889 domain-containing protein [Lysinibacillus irui]